MYRVTLINDGQRTIIHNPFTGGNKLLTGVIKLEVGKVGQFDFQFLPNNDGYKVNIRPLLTLVEVVNEKTREEIFFGRIAPISKDMPESGITTFTYNARSELDFLNDSQQRQEIYKGTKSGFIKKILDWHNELVETYKEFRVGNIADFIGENDYMEAEIDPNKKTLTTINDLIVAEYGLELQVRKVDGIKYLDLLKRVGVDSQTSIKLTVNMTRNSQKINPDGIITRLVPLGKKDDKGKPLDIASVNAGKIYIDRQDLIDQFGVRMATQPYDDVTEPGKLKELGQSFMEAQRAISYQYTVEAINLNLIKENFDELKEGNSYQVINPIMGIDERLRIVSRSIDISKVEKSNLVIGEKFKSAEEWQLDAVRQRTKQLVSTARLQATEEELARIRAETERLLLANAENQSEIENTTETGGTT
ncbi:TPA: phage tail protein [Streptococcus suis]|nr:phage tail protein [Streptococcus suis]HEM5234859.1 phage tail protein [Streptococcus suis]HEM5241879.1 phage tail protein [Streptococcus suis]